MVKGISIFIILACIIGYANAQEDFKAHEYDLLDTYKTMVDSAFDFTKQDYRKKFRHKLLTVLTKPGSYNYAFEKLTKRLSIIQSLDKKVKIFSFDDYGGGTWHTIFSYAQYIDKSGNEKVVQLHSGREMELGGFTDVSYYKIHDIISENSTYYLMFGWGTHGAGHHHRMIRLMHFVDGDIIDCQKCLDGKTYIPIESARSYNPGIVYDSIEQKISYDHFVPDNGDFLVPSGRIISLILKQGAKNTISFVREK